MKTYHSSNDAKKRNFFMRHLRAFIITFGAIVVATAVTLAIVFSLPKAAPVINDDPKPDDPDTTISVVLPVSGATVGTEFSNTELVKWETLNQWMTHEGIDFIVAAGTDVVAVTDGTVLSVEDTNLEGKVVTIEHSDGYKSVYKSLADEVVVTEGQAVKTGDKIGTVANTMMTEELTGAHLHFELYKGSDCVNPAELIPLETDK